MMINRPYDDKSDENGYVRFGRIGMDEVVNALDDLMSTYSDPYDRLEALARVFVHLERLARLEGFGSGVVATYALAMSRHEN